MKRGIVAWKSGQEPIVPSTLWAIWLLVPAPFSKPQNLVVLHSGIG